MLFYEHLVDVGLRQIDWDGGHIVHREWPAQLNRFCYLTPLATMFVETGDERLAEAARRYIDDWIDSHPDLNHSFGQPGKGPPDFCLRLGTADYLGWGGTVPLFLRSSHFGDVFLARFFASMTEQLHFLADHLMAGGNHRIWNLDSLVMNGIRFPFIDRAAELVGTGVTGLRHAFRAQFLADGCHVELSPGYSLCMAEVTVNYKRLANLFPETDTGVTLDAVERSLAYAVQSEMFPVNDAVAAPTHDPGSFDRLGLRANPVREGGV